MSKHPLLSRLAFPAKLFLAIGSLWYVFYQLDIPQMLEHIKAVNPFYLMGSALVLAAAQVVSAFRQRYYFHTAGLAMSHYFSIALYFVGTFFNLVLPGGIGGDGYKVFLLSRTRHFSKMKSLKLMVSNRASGLFVLILYTCLLAYFSHIINIIPYAALWVTLAFIGVIPCYLISVKFLLSEEPRVALGALPYSIIVQGACVISAYLLFIGVGLDLANQQLVMDYLMLFMISSIVSVVPISVGGIGLREVTFLAGGKFFEHIDSEFGVAFSLIYFAVNSFISLFGVYFYIRLKGIIERDGKIHNHHKKV